LINQVDQPIKGHLDKGHLDKGHLDKGRLDKGRLDDVRGDHARRPGEAAARARKREDRRRLPNWRLRSEGGRMGTSRVRSEVKARDLGFRQDEPVD
jgi:hypothetical protein